MNNRLKELAIKAGLIVGGSNGFDRTMITPAEKRFAELIVRECADVITETRWHLPPTQQQVALSIKEHFGVE